MQKGSRVTVAAVLLALLGVVLYPALFMGSRVSPEASLRGTAPWREQWGPHPPPQPSAIRVARTLAPRLETLAREGFSCALWNPYIGGGRPGWIVSAQEGGTPLTLLAGFAARRGWTFTALVATVLSTAFLAATFLFRRIGASPWAAIAGGVAYTLSGAVSVSLLHPSGSAVALGPLALAAAVSERRSKTASVAVWGAVLAGLGWSGAAALPFLAMALVLLLLRPRALAVRLAPVCIGALLAVALLAPRWWLASVGGEPGAPPGRSTIAEPLVTPAAFVIVSARDPDDSASGAEIPAVSSAEAAFLGVPVALLALLGLARLRRRVDLVWAAFVTTGIWLAFAPARLVAGLGLSERPFAALALAVAALAAFGCDRLLASVPSQPWQAGIGAAVALIIATRLLPAAAQQIPFSPAAEGSLPSPLPATACADGSRLVGLLDTIPPDVAASLGLRDARAADLEDEPAYAGLLAAGSGGLLPVAGALRPALAALGVRWVLEPLPLRIVSGEIFAAVELRTATRVAVGRDWAEYRIGDPGQKVRVGLASDLFAGTTVHESRPGRLVRLPEDATLASETAAWTWWTVPPSPSARELVLRVGPGVSPAPRRIEVALDRSNVSLVGESLGARIWRRDDAVDLLTATPAGAAALRLIEASPQRTAAQVSADRDVTVQLLLKYRPGLRRATVDDAETEIQASGPIWSAVRVPRGTHRLVVESRMPGLVRASFLLGAALLAVAWVIGRRT